MQGRFQTPANVLPYRPAPAASGPPRWRRTIELIVGQLLQFTELSTLSGTLLGTMLLTPPPPHSEKKKRVSGAILPQTSGTLTFRATLCHLCSSALATRS